MPSNTIRPPTSREAGYMIGSSLNHFPKSVLASGAEAWAYRDAGVSEVRFANELLLLAAAAALHAIESAGLKPADENDLAEGFYSWMHQLDAITRAVVLTDIEWAVDAYAAAVADEASEPASPGQPKQLELEFFDRLLSFGAQDESRAKSCTKLAIAVPVQDIWEVHFAAANQLLMDARLINSNDA